ncbi:uncharacterized protein LOC132260190 isoform X2 [Phlebotomus argentipes]|nr:uncharacterized protein LOC132260190 isoform X2 [Phlebotomus argentipes]
MDPVPPVAPPRKKRPSMLSQDGRKVKNGFKDVFGGDTPRRFSCDSVDNSARPREMSVDVVVPLKQSQSYDFDSIGFADFSQEHSPTSELDKKVLPRVGNKKSDKFFGENLSDCLSDEYVSDDQKKPDDDKRESKDAIEKFVEENKVSAESAQPQKEKLTKSNSLDKKAEFLMAMLDGYAQEDALYAGRVPVEEPLIVPKRKQSKHICDDDDHMHHRHFHKYESSDAVGPKKPDRDLAKYRKSVENLDEITAPAEVEKPARKKRSISREDLPTAPPPPSKAPENVTIVEVVSSQLPPISPKPRTMKKIPSMPSMPNNLVLSSVDKTKDIATKRSQLQKCQSSGALVPEDLMSEIKRRVYEFQMSQEYLPEEIVHHGSDGSDLVKPQSKLEKRKVSVTKKISNASSADLEPIPDEDAKRTMFSIGNTTVKITEEVKEMAKEPRGSLTEIREPYKNTSDVIPDKPLAPLTSTPITIPAKKDVTDLPAGESAFSQVSRQKTEDSLEKIIHLPDFDVKAISNVLDDIYANNKSILEEFQSFLEMEADSLEDFTTVDIKDEKTRETPDRELKNNVPEISVERERSRTSSSSGGSISDDNYTEIIKDTPKEQVTNKTLLALAVERGRRESIDDVNNWFDNHIDSPLVSPTIQNLFQEARKGRRGSDFTVGYDTTALYPFGKQLKQRSGSQSEDFFENVHHSKSADNVARNETTATEEDHSNLLKFFKNEANADRVHSVPN